LHEHTEQVNRRRDRSQIIKETLEIMQGGEKTYSRIMNKVGSDQRRFKPLFNMLKSNGIITGRDRGNGQYEYMLTKEGSECLRDLKRVLACLSSY